LEACRHYKILAILPVDSVFGRNWNRGNGAGYDRIFESTLIAVAVMLTLTLALMPSE